MHPSDYTVNLYLPFFLPCSLAYLPFLLSLTSPLSASLPPHLHLPFLPPLPHLFLLYFISPLHFPLLSLTLSPLHLPLLPLLPHPSNFLFFPFSLSPLPFSPLPQLSTCLISPTSLSSLSLPHPSAILASPHFTTYSPSLPSPSSPLSPHPSPRWLDFRNLLGFDFH